MSIISTEYLAKLGRERAIPFLFEYSWMQMLYCRNNPVVGAMKIVENKRRIKNNRFLILCMLVILAVSGFPIMDFVKYDGHATSAAVWYLAQVVLLTFVFLRLALEIRNEKVDNAARSYLVDDFCKCLDLMIEWSDFRHTFDTELFRGSDEEIKKVGTNILVEAATKVLRIQKEEKSEKSPEIKEWLQVSAGNAMAEFTKRYNTLSCLGLASGGYDKYFEHAQRTIDSAAIQQPIR